MSGLFHEFFADIKLNGVAKTSHFQVLIPTMPGSLIRQYPGYSQQLAMRCEATDLPGRQIITQDSRIYGPTYKTPYQSLYQEITLTFLETQEFFIRTFFEAWLDTIFDSTDNTLDYPVMYRTDMMITQFDVSVPQGGESLQRIATWHLVNAFPTAANQMPVAWTEDGFHRIAVTMAYEYYTLSKPDMPKKQTSGIGPTEPVQTGSARGTTGSILI